MMWRTLSFGERESGRAMIGGFRGAIDRSALNIVVEKVYIEAAVMTFDDLAPVACYRLSVKFRVIRGASLRGYRSPDITPMQFMRWPRTMGGLIADWMIHDLKSGVKDENKNE